MNTRSMKRRKINEEIEMANEKKINLDDALDEINEKGASCLKYEIVRKRDAKTGKEKKILHAKRCSIRHKCIGLDE